MIVWKVDYTVDASKEIEGYVGRVLYCPTKRDALRACRELDIPIRDAEIRLLSITKLTLKSKYDVIEALYDALMIDNSYGGV